ncbi:hypothetical protein GCM10025771_11310 [Niveibacterium umoris]|uniref:Diguanylate cyclase (GGDEF)-like protein n=1 Tax=Niveibacterium umoris TaxID=1193620 RepID=A0A840BSH5_9RHOO|nr:diguanylate cyclase [Niveibacterium umoris]MBB4013317.1 diguanylate cyclase (GGDEF)-like protein [Niveibacterium umoris]
MKAIAISVAMFMLLDSSVLAINLWISHELDETSVEINLAGRQRMLSQRMTKAALQTLSAEDGTRLAAAEVELFEAARLFDETLQGFGDGGEVTAGNGRRVQVTPIDDPVAIELLAQARTLWRPIMATVRVLGLEAAPAPRQRIAQELGAHEAELLDLMNRLTSRIEAVSLERTQALRAVQMGAFSLALLNFALVIVLLLARYRAADRRGQQLEGMIDQIAAGVCLLDNDEQIVAANPAAMRILGRGIDTLRGHRVTTFLDADEGVWRGERPDGGDFHVALSHGEIGTDEGKVRVVTLLDISERVDAESRLRQLALHDALTGLPNRRMLDDRLTIALAQAQRGYHKVGVAMVDLDGFKPINDTYGHATGDCVLQAVAQRLAACARAGDTVARLGGDEFVCVFSTLHDREELDTLGRRMLEALAQPLLQGALRIPMSASIGLALSPDDGSDTAGLLKAADSAMYAAKHAGGRRLAHADRGAAPGRSGN